MPADAVWGMDQMAATAAGHLYHALASMNIGKIMIDRLEYAVDPGRDGYALEGVRAWRG